ncbi:MAG TPA: cytochrome c oxidase subunit 3 [Acidimicrobiales bacterium]|jgi:cytochrome c oxidase subunit 3
MSTATTEIDVFTDAPAPEPPRPRVLLVGTLFAGGAVSTAILGMIALYAQVRAETLADGTTWLPKDTNLPLGPGNMGFVSLLMSAIAAAWAVYALRNDDRAHAYFALGLTLMFGVAFIVDTAYLWQQFHLGVADSYQAVLIYSITGAHVAMTVGGMLYLAVMGFRALGGQLTGRAAEGLEAAALFWFMTVGVYAVVWYTIYITK